MTPLFMLDTNMVSYIVKGRSAMARRQMIESQTGAVVCISSITEAEIHYGLCKRPEATALRERMGWFLASLRVLPWGREEAVAYGSIRAKLETVGKSIKDMDLLIAAHAVAAQATLVSNDSAFRQIEGQPIVNWATDLPAN